MTISFQTIKQLAQYCGFALCGIAKSEPLINEQERFKKALAQNYHAQRAYLERDIEKRFHPSLMLDNCKSVVVCGFNYYMKREVGGERYKISKHSQIRDYHLFMKDKLENLAHRLEEKIGAFHYRATVDSSNISEKAWAVQAGIGYYGKNGIIQTQFGSFVFIGILLIDKEVDKYDKPTTNSCGNCSRCIDACPVQAIVEPYYIDCNQCITAITSNKKETDFSGISKYGWFNACDECQNVCPNNAHTPINTEAVLMRASFLENKTEILETLTPESFEHYFKNTVLYPFKYEGLKRRVETFKEKNSCF